MKRKRKIVEQETEISVEHLIYSLDKAPTFLPGWPGYRNAHNRYGLGYFETQSEWAHMRGVFLAWMFTGKFRTHNPIYLLFMFVVGVMIGILPLGATLYGVFITGRYMALVYLFLFSPNVAVGILLIINVFISIFNPNQDSITGD
jgi:hypothetical protein